MILSAFFTVDNLCAITTMVCDLLCEMLSIALCTSRSDFVSNADVASSNSKIDGLLTMARAMAMRCFCPPLNRLPISPHDVSYCFGNFMMNSCASANLAALTTSSSVIDGSPPRIFSRMDSANSNGNCET
mmetsp:Transcript_28880/g.45728  ORF Transcript_28880/g.45728 Transcript_28880/m.45728 type:complete len:130 (+) Transcript_28880:495-884(+)